MTPERLAEIEARVKAATPGPWYRVGPPWNDDVAYVIAGNEDPHTGTFVCDIAALADEGNANDVVDAEFIAHARDDVPALVAEVRRLRAAMDAALALHGRSRIKGWCNGCTDRYPCATVRALAPVADPGPHTTSDKETT